MKRKTLPCFNHFPARPHATRAQVRVVMLVTIAFALGLGGGAFLFRSRSGRSTPIEQPDTGAAGLSAATMSILAAMEGPVEIHYYAILDPASTASGDTELAARTDRLLALYEAAAEGKIKIVRYDHDSDMGPQSAAKDGISAFNLDKGDACYLGIAVLGNGRKESLARLSADWEGALESDLSRAISGVSRPQPAATPVATATGPDPLIIKEVKTALPNLDSITKDQGAQVLREAALKDAQAAIQEMSPKIQAAQKRLVESRESGSAGDQQTALAEYQAVQSEQARRIQDISSHLQKQLEVLSVIKPQ